MENNEMNIDYSKFKCGYVALIGRPNVGKSTLLNNLLQIKLSIVTPKPQTTRHRVLGIMNEADKQVVFLDTPGLLKPKYKLQEVMLKTAHKAVEEADIVLFMVESDSESSFRDILLLNEIISINKPVILVLNKIDKIGKSQILPLISTFQKKTNISEIIPISALKSDGVDILKEAIFKHLPQNHPFYPLDTLTEHPERFFVSEIIREKIFQQYSEEIPYSTTVSIEEFTERDHGKDYISATIFVERSSQKGILIGKKGKALKTIGQLSRDDIEVLLQRQVFLDLHVSVKEKWRSKDRILKDLGYQ